MVFATGANDDVMTEHFPTIAEDKHSLAGQAFDKHLGDRHFVMLVCFVNVKVPSNFLYLCHLSLRAWSPDLAVL